MHQHRFVQIIQHQQQQQRIKTDYFLGRSIEMVQEKMDARDVIE